MALDPKFKLGRVVMTVEAHDLFKTQQIDVANYLDRHAAGDCPELSDRDQDTNDYGIEFEARVMSVYTIPIEPTTAPPRFGSSPMRAICRRPSLFQGTTEMDYTVLYYDQDGKIQPLCKKGREPPKPGWEAFFLRYPEVRIEVHRTGYNGTHHTWNLILSKDNARMAINDFNSNWGAIDIPKLALTVLGYDCDSLEEYKTLKVFTENYGHVFDGDEDADDQIAEWFHRICGYAEGLNAIFGSTGYSEIMELATC